jgi:hypothetical protein
MAAIPLLPVLPVVPVAEVFVEEREARHEELAHLRDRLTRQYNRTLQ